MVRVNLPAMAVLVLAVPVVVVDHGELLVAQLRLLLVHQALLKSQEPLLWRAHHEAKNVDWKLTLSSFETDCDET